ncbi:uncharacterized protein LOC133328350 [Musca vetustissima]|uniref:uncharacterized protein LOC133328350 n=1 Tax=Musca vetustissima TaxID=27455 RepID=UPI002AB6D961|nr:uncharacterized protein LOC133328350 [Musca vetustissima]
MSYYNDDELAAPDWINKEFLEKVLKEYHNNVAVEIVKFELSPASMKGDHYASVMFRCKVEYRLNATTLLNKSLIMKTIPSAEGMKQEILKKTKVFETEIGMYTEALPKICQILKEHGEETLLTAGIIYHSLTPHKIIILEDLCELGYDAIRGRHLNVQEVKAVYTKLAKLHAVSFALGQSEDHKVVTKFQDGFMSISIPALSDYMDNGFRNFIQLLASYPEFEIYHQKLTEMQKYVLPSCKNLFNSYVNGEKGIFVLNHGDFHMKNLMFKWDRNSGEMEDVILLDYQASCFAPSNIDLLYSQFLLLSPELRMKRKEFMRHYFVEFCRILKKIKFNGDMPKYSEFQMDCLKYRHFCIYVLVVIYPLVAGFWDKSVEELKDTNTTEMVENPDLIAANYNRPEFVEEMRTFLPILLDEGYFD